MLLPESLQQRISSSFCAAVELRLIMDDDAEVNTLLKKQLAGLNQVNPHCISRESEAQMGFTFGQWHAFVLHGLNDHDQCLPVGLDGLGS